MPSPRALKKPFPRTAAPRLFKCSPSLENSPSPCSKCSHMFKNPTPSAWHRACSLRLMEILRLFRVYPPLTGRIPDSTICPTRTLFNSLTNSRYLPMTSSDPFLSTSFVPTWTNTAPPLSQVPPHLPPDCVRPGCQRQANRSARTSGAPSYTPRHPQAEQSSPQWHTSPPEPYRLPTTPQTCSLPQHVPAAPP